MINSNNKIIEDLSQEVRFLKDQLSALHREIDSLHQVKTFPENRKSAMPAKDAEFSLRQNENYLKSVSNILQSEKQSIHDFLDHVLNESIALTESRWGYLFFYSEESRLLKLNSWSKVFSERDPEKKSDVFFSIDETGVWGDAIRQRNSITATDFYVPDLLEGKISDKTIHLHSFMNIPVFSEGKIVALIGLANKDVEYKDFDVLQITLLMEVAWKVVKRKLTEISL
ncbi:MAG: GAF domain-containing protein, partial [Bacteroidales bacterium]|nr:GAF domain-containing protein [Bacteroidales bacterium]